MVRWAQRQRQQPLLVRCLVSVKPRATGISENTFCGYATRVPISQRRATEPSVAKGQPHSGLHYNAEWPVLKRSSPLSVTTWLLSWVLRWCLECRRLAQLTPNIVRELCCAVHQATEPCRESHDPHSHDLTGETGEPRLPSGRGGGRGPCLLPPVIPWG